MIYDATTRQPIESPDLEKGYLVDGTIITGYATEVFSDTVTAARPEGISRLVSVAEPCQWYYLYPDKETAVSNKLQELSAACNAAITAGTTVQLSDGAKKQFSYSIEDQANVSEIFNAVLMGATAYPYHANGENCQMYSAADIATIYATLSGLKTAQTTYYNQLRQYVQTLETVPAINAVQYGDALTGTFLETYNTLLAQAQSEMQKILAKVAANAG